MASQGIRIIHIRFIAFIGIWSIDCGCLCDGGGVFIGRAGGEGASNSRADRKCARAAYFDRAAVIGDSVETAGGQRC